MGGSEIKIQRVAKTHKKGYYRPLVDRFNPAVYLLGAVLFLAVWMTWVRFERSQTMISKYHATTSPKSSGP